MGMEDGYVFRVYAKKSFKMGVVLTYVENSLSSRAQRDGFIVILSSGEGSIS